MTAPLLEAAQIEVQEARGLVGPGGDGAFAMPQPVQPTRLATQMFFA